MVEHSFGVWIVRIRRILIELYLMEKKKKEKRKNEEEEQKRNFHVQFSPLWGEVMGLWGYVLHKNS